MTNPANLLEALLPDPTKTSFPVPKLIRSSGPTGSFTYESFNLGGVPMPGQWLLVDAPRVFGWQILKAYGQSYATVLPIGDDLVKARFAIRIWTSADAGVYRQLLKTTLRKPVGLMPGSTSAAGLGIDQPQLLDIGVSSVVVARVTPLYNPLVTSGGRGPWTAECELLEYRKPLAALPKPNQSIPAKSPPKPTAQDAQDIEIQKLSSAFGAKAAALQQALSGGPNP